MIINNVKNLLEGEKALTSKLINKCEEVLRNVLEGLVRNESVKPQHLILLCYALIKESLTNMEKTEDKNLWVDNIARTGIHSFP